MTLSEPFDDTIRRGTPLVWATGSAEDRRALFGWGESLRVDAEGPSRFQDLADAFRAFVSRSGSDPRAVVAFVTVTFADDSDLSSTLIVPEVLGRWEAGRLVVPRGAVLPEPGAPADFEELELLPGDLTREGYRRAVAEAVRRIRQTALEKVVLARDLEAVSPDPIDVSTVLTRLQEGNPRTWTFHVDGLLGSSPELLAATTGRRVRSQVLAGSANATGDAHTDDQTATRLAASAKDHAEHLYAARSVTDKLREIAEVSSVNPVVIRLPRIMHLATDVTGLLHHDLTALDVAAALHPSAAVCGTPADLAEHVLSELEGFDRGRYAGPVGWMDGTGDGEFALALRCGQVSQDGCSIRLFAGGGIVAGSNPSEELAETAQKFLPMYEAVSPLARP